MWAMTRICRPLVSSKISVEIISEEEWALTAVQGLTRFRHLSKSANRRHISNIEKRGLSPLSNPIPEAKLRLQSVMDSTSKDHHINSEKERVLLLDYFNFKYIELVELIIITSDLKVRWNQNIRLYPGLGSPLAVWNSQSSGNPEQHVSLSEVSAAHLVLIFFFIIAFYCWTFARSCMETN